MSSPNNLDRTIFSFAAACHCCGARFEEPSLVCPNDGSLLANGLRTGAVIANRYLYLSTIGNGGMGLIVRAHDSKLDVDVALKMLLRNNSDADIKRFKQEARAASLLEHRNIIKMCDFGTTEDGCPYLVMEYIDGEDLSSVLSKRGAMTISEATEIFDQLCDAMSYAHAKGVLHRDLKPSNIMLMQRSARVEVKIVDFGIAKIVAPDGNMEKSLTQSGQILGSPIYMSPEQALGKPADACTDIYSAACVLYEMLTGAPPIMGDSSMETLFKHVNAVPLRLTEAAIGVTFSKELEDVVDRALQKDRSKRQQSFRELKDEFHHALSPGPKQPVNNDSPEKLRLPGKRLFVLAAIIVLTAGSVVSGIWFVQNFQQRQQVKVTGSPVAEGPAGPAVPADIQGTSSKRDNLADKPGTFFDVGLTADDVARVQIPVLIKQPGYIDFKDNDRAVSDITIENLVAALRADDPGRLRNLDLDRTSIDDEGIKKLLELSPKLRLKSLCVAHTRVGPAGLQMISKLSSLERLDVGYLTGLKSDSLSVLGELHKLRYLSFGGSYEHFDKPIDLRFLSRFPLLESICANFNHKAIDDSNTRVFSSLTKLSFLDLSNCQIGDGTLSQLSRLNKLETLLLCETNITDRSIPAIGHLDNLKKLIIRRVNITDAALTTLSRMYEQNRLDLNELDIRQCHSLSDKACSDLQQAMPHCLVRWRANDTRK